VLQRFGGEYLREHRLSTSQAKAWRAIVSCRTQALGGQLMRCDGCGALQWRWHSCRNRHCPQCQARERDAWRRARLGELLDVPYCHLVFTLPHELNALAAAHPRWVYETLMQCTAATLREFAANPRFGWVAWGPSL
jgi:Transposase zinc-binding domain